MTKTLFTLSAPVRCVAVLAVLAFYGQLFIGPSLYHDFLNLKLAMNDGRCHAVKRQFGAGSLTAVIGANGAGKSTFLKTWQDFSTLSQAQSSSQGHLPRINAHSWPIYRSRLSWIDSFQSAYLTWSRWDAGRKVVCSAA